MQKNKYLFLVIGLFLPLLFGCDRRKDAIIDTFSFPSPDGSMLAIRIGPEREGYPDQPPIIEKCKGALLRLSDNELEGYQLINHEGNIWLSMAWNPIRTNEMVFATYNYCTRSESNLPAGSLLKLTVDSKTTNITEINKLDKYPCISESFCWSPNGLILAGLVVDWPHSMSHGKLGVSFDSGQTTILTEIPMYHARTPVWITDEELFLQTDDRTIVKVIREEKIFVIDDEILESSVRLSLCGVIGDKPVYKTRDRVYVGDEILFESKGRIGFVKADQYIILESQGKVFVFDDKLKLLEEKQLEKQVKLLGFSPKTKTVFLLKDWETILLYNFEGKEESREIFILDLINGY